MIARLEGVLFERTPSRVVLDVHGVGYEVFVPLSTYERLPDDGKTVALRIHTHAREGALQLYGFLSAPEQAAFELLLHTSRVGPKLAQTVLSGIRPTELLRAIRERDTGPLKRVSGVGAKLAERILVELKDRADELALALDAPPGPGDVTARGAREDAISALQNLGYTRGESERVLADVSAELGDDASIETCVRAALRRLAR
ncbi:MAG TPA: Holliday junction branch migration protein RuvA [Myxococcota bacterium]|nr:Holliday junction branch migration protein RuvA [Myxococcota bacterium]